jgi:hydrogenase maturation protease
MSAPEGTTTTPVPTGVTLVLGLGNPLLADDGIGWHVAQALAARLTADPALAADPAYADVEIDHLAGGGLSLMERLVGYRRAVLIEATVTGDELPGTVRHFRLTDRRGRSVAHADTARDASLATVLATGRSLGADLPVEIATVVVEAVRVDELGGALTPAVAAAIPAAVDAVLAAIGETGG